MAITDVDSALAGMQPNRYFHKSVTPTMVAGRPQSTWGLGGIPGAGSFDNTSAEIERQLLDDEDAMIALLLS